MTDVKVVQNDYGYDVTFTITDEDENAVIITGATILFKVGKPGETMIISAGACNVTDGTNGVCTYTVLEDDFAVVGTYDAELQITFSGGTPIITIPNLKVYVRGELE